MKTIKVIQVSLLNKIFELHSINLNFLNNRKMRPPTSSSSTSSTFCILQRSLNPLAPRKFGLVALKTINKGTVYQIVTDKKSKTPLTISSTDDDDNNNSINNSNKYFQDLSQPPKTLYDLLFRRYMWNIKDHGFMELMMMNENNNNNNSFENENHDNFEDSTNSGEVLKIHLPPPFLMIPTKTTVYALGDPTLIAKQVFDVATAENDVTSDEHENDDSLVPPKNENQNQNKNTTSTKSSSATAIGHNILTLQQVLSINDTCSIPVPAPISEQLEQQNHQENQSASESSNNNTEKNNNSNNLSTNPSNLDPAFWRSFPDLMQQYEELSSEQANCVIDFMTRQELIERGVMTTNNNIEIDEDEISRREQIEAEKEDKQLAKLAKEFRVGPEYDDADAHEFIHDEDDDRLLDGDLLMKKRLEKKRQLEEMNKKGRGGGRNPYKQRELRRRKLKGENVEQYKNEIEAEREQQQMMLSSQNEFDEDDDSLHLVLRVTKRINPGSEFHVSYGREFWTQFAGACAFTSTLSLPRVRWVEKYLSHDYRDLPISFPDVTVGRSKPGVFHLVDRMTESKASDDAVVAEYVRRLSLMKVAYPNATEKKNTVEASSDGDNSDKKPQLLRSTLDRTAHRLLEKNLEELMAKMENDGNTTDTTTDTSTTDALVQKAAERVASQGTDGLLKQEITMKDLRSLLAEDILKGKKKKKSNSETETE